MAKASYRLRAHCAALAYALLAPHPALAFSDPETFGNPVDEGGGGGRYFTGSPADGYTCKVCHQGAAGPDIEVLGLPLGGYTPGAAYEVTIDWSDELDDIALSLELTSRNGHAAGTLRTPPESELLDPERCIPATAGIGAGSLLDAPSRSILTVPNCGAQRVRFLWTAPSDDVGPVWFAGSLVRGDGKGDVRGDGVTDFTSVLGSPLIASKDAMPIDGGCSATPAALARRPNQHAGAIWILLLGVSYAWLRRRQVCAPNDCKNC